MSPKDKVVELVGKMFLHQVPSALEMNRSGGMARAKECALIAVDEILNQYEDNTAFCYKILPYEEREWWEEVKEEINLL